LAGFLSVECGSWNSILNPIYNTAALPGQTTKTALTEEFMFQNVAYRPTVYITGILAKLKNCQNGTFEPVHEIKKKIWLKAFFWNIMKMAIRKNIHNLSQGPPNPGFMQKKVQKGYFLKKPSRELKNYFCFRFLWISWRPGTLNWERVYFGCLKTCTSSAHCKSLLYRGLY
jgi:hypothetical protein